MAYLLETSRFGLFSYGPITIDVLCRRRPVPQEPDSGPGAPHEYSESLPASTSASATETARSGTRRPNELHFLLAFMRTLTASPLRCSARLGVEPQSVEGVARRQATGPGSGAFLSPEEVARRLDVNVQTVRAWIRSGKLPASRLAGRRILRIRESDLSALLEPVELPSDFA